MLVRWFSWKIVISRVGVVRRLNVLFASSGTSDGQSKGTGGSEAETERRHICSC